MVSGLYTGRTLLWKSYFPREFNPKPTWKNCGASRQAHKIISGLDVVCNGKIVFESNKFGKEKIIFVIFHNYGRVSNGPFEEAVGFQPKKATDCWISLKSSILIGLPRLILIIQKQRGFSNSNRLKYQILNQRIPISSLSIDQQKETQLKALERW